MQIDSSPVYLDASGLAKLYVEEPGSDEIERALVGRRDVVVSDLAVTEVVSALARRLRERDLSSKDAKRVHRQILADVARGEFRQVGLSPDVHRAAERLLVQLGGDVPLRTLDALHLALAVGASARAFVTYDRRLRDAATRMSIFDVHG